MKVVMTEADLDALQIIKDFDFESGSHEEYREMMKAVMHFVGYRIEKDMIPPHGTGERKCPTCRNSIIWPHRFCQHCGQRIVDAKQKAVNASNAKRNAEKRKAKEGCENAGDE